MAKPARYSPTLKYERVILLTSDATGAELVTPQTAPSWWGLGQAGIWCERAYAHGNPTQFSFPSIMTSSLPLDYGGYDWGIRGRPVALAEVMRQAGFKSVGFSTTVWLSGLFGYGRGFDQLFAFHNPIAGWNGSLSIYVAYWTKLLAERRISRDTYEAEMKTLLSKWLAYYRAHCDFNAAAAEDVPIADHRAFGWENQMRGVRDRLCAEHDHFLRNADEYLATRASRLARLDLRNFLRLPCTGGNSKYVPARHTFDAVLEVLRREPRSPVFIWAHFRDVHDFDSLPQALDRTRGVRTRQRALAYWDTQLERFMDLLRRYGLDDGTLLVVFSDHGSGSAASLGDRGLRVPLVFWSPKIERQVVMAPCGLWDLAPTVLDLVGLPAEPAFQGTSIHKLDGCSPHLIIAEHSGRGPCDLLRKRIHLSITNGQFKCIFHEDNHLNGNTICLDERSASGDIPPAIRVAFQEASERRCREIRAARKALSSTKDVTYK